MAKKIMLLLLIFSILLISFAYSGDSERFGYGITKRIPINYSLVPTVNNSLYWDGNAFDINRWLLIDGSNANQNINIFPYNLTANFLKGDGREITNINFNGYNPFNQSLNTSDNVTFENLNISKHLEVYTINATNITTENINVTKNSTIYLGGVPISSATDFNGQQVVTFGDAFINATGYFGDGGFLDNISFINGTVIALAFNSSVFYGGNYSGNNFSGDNFFGGNFFGVYDWTAQSPYLLFNGTFLSFNDALLNQTIQEIANNSINNLTSITLNGTTITDWSQVNYTVNNATVTTIIPSFTGSYSVVLPNNFNFEIAQIIVTPDDFTGNYRFGMYEVTGETIDADLIKHKGTWNIFKSYPINNKVSLNFSNVNPVNNFTVTIKYFKNVQN